MKFISLVIVGLLFLVGCGLSRQPIGLTPHGLGTISGELRLHNLLHRYRFYGPQQYGAPLRLPPPQYPVYCMGTNDGGIACY